MSGVIIKDDGRSLDQARIRWCYDVHSLSDSMCWKKEGVCQVDITFMLVVQAVK